jgi:methylthioribose-1-phosphate isomerase
VTPIVWAGDRLRLIDQRVLPHEERWLECRSAEDVARAIHDMAVRGAPAIGIAAGYGLALALQADPKSYDAAEAVLAKSRPTAVNLRWVLERLRGLPERSAPAVLAEARRIHEEDLAQNRRMAQFGAALLPKHARVLTHCNTGALATGGHGTALGVIRTAHAQGKIAQVFATETRPWLQGARLTAWELGRAGVPFELVVDSAAAGLIRRGDADAVIAGCDRVARNGDVANKVGTYGLALAARAASIPFVIAGPTSSIDPDLPHGDRIAIEERGAEEVLALGGADIAPPGTAVRNPAFDVTPAELITALVTERGVVAPPTAAGVAELLER